MPLVVLHVPALDLVRLQGRITDSGNIMVNRPVPFSLVKEVWFCIPKDTDRKTFDHIEKVMDGDLEDEMALEYQASPILRDFKKMKTPARMMQLLCDMPSGPHNAEKERLPRELAATIDYYHEDARRLHYLKEAANFMIKRTHPGDLVMDSATKFVCDCVLPPYSVMLLQVLYLLVAAHLAREVQKARTNKRRVTNRGSEC